MQEQDGSDEGNAEKGRDVSEGNAEKICEGIAERFCEGNAEKFFEGNAERVSEGNPERGADISGEAWNSWKPVNVWTLELVEELTILERRTFVKPFGTLGTAELVEPFGFWGSADRRTLEEALVG